MKIVKFRDGTYGVRRFHILYGYQFLSKRSTPDDYYWYTFLISSGIYMTYAEAVALYRRMRTKKKKPEPKFDYGKAIPKDEYRR